MHHLAWNHCEIHAEVTSQLLGLRVEERRPLALYGTTSTFRMVPPSRFGDTGMFYSGTVVMYGIVFSPQFVDSVDVVELREEVDGPWHGGNVLSGRRRRFAGHR